MSQTLDNGIIVPINADAWNLAPDLQTLGNSAKVVTTVANSTARDLLTLYTGRLVWRIDTQELEFYDGAAWVPFVGQQATADIATFSTGWSALTGAHKPRVRRQGNMVYLFGGVQSSASASNAILTIPTAFRPPDTTTRFVGSVITSNSSSATLALANGIISIPAGYGAINVATVQTVPVVAHWCMD